MREIKFRAWDGKSVRYDVTGFEHGGKNEMAGIFLNGDFYHIGGDSPVDACAEVMQFTGLLDKNGREIYEGDIVKWRSKYRDDSEYRSDEVTFNGYWNLRPWIQELYETADDREIIGNIYENPELLGVEA